MRTRSSLPTYGSSPSRRQAMNSPLKTLCSPAAIHPSDLSYRSRINADGAFVAEQKEKEDLEEIATELELVLDENELVQ